MSVRQSPGLGDTQPMEAVYRRIGALEADNMRTADMLRGHIDESRKAREEMLSGLGEIRTKMQLDEQRDEIEKPAQLTRDEQAVIRAWLAREARKQKRFEDLANKAAGSVVVLTLGGFLTWVGSHGRIWAQFLLDHMGKGK